MSCDGINYLPSGQGALSRRNPGKGGQLRLLLAGQSINRFPLFGRQFKLRGRDVFFQVRERRRSGNREHHGRPLKKPGQRELNNAYTALLGSSIDSRTIFQASASSYRRPRYKPKSFFFAILKRIFPLAVGDIIAVLNAHNRNDLARPLDFFW